MRYVNETVIIPDMLICVMIHDTSLQEEGLSVPDAARRYGIPRSTAYKMRADWNESNGEVLPGQTKEDDKESTSALLAVLQAAVLFYLPSESPYRRRSVRCQAQRNLRVVSARIQTILLRL